MQPSDPAKYNDPRHVAEKVERTTQGALHDVGKKVHLMQTSTTCERHKQHVDEINAYQTSAWQCDFVLRLTALRFEVLSFPRNCTSKKARIRSRWALKLNPFPLLLNTPPIIKTPWTQPSRNHPCPLPIITIIIITLSEYLLGGWGEILGAPL